MFESAAGVNGGFGRGGHGPLLLSMEAELEAWRAIRHRTASAVIHRVPPSMRLDSRSVEPAVVSIGPYHRGRPDLMAMEQNKWRSLDVILQLNRSRKMGDYLREMAAMEPRARGCYAEDVGYMGGYEFAAMMLLDGCFLAVPFLGEQRGVPAAGRPPEWFTPAVARDVLLLENQIPLFVVRRIMDLASPPAAGSDQRPGSAPSALLPKRVAETLKDLLGLHANMAMESAALQVHHHLLDLLHSMFFRPVFESEASTEVARESSNSKKEKDQPDGGGRASADAGLRTLLCLLPSAWELQDAGVKLGKREQRGLLDATFRDSTMQVPFLRVDRFTASLLQNLVAWESTHPSAGNGVTVYVLFMDRLVRTGRDVTVLAEKGIVEHRMGGDGEIPSLFDGIAAGLPLELDGVCYLKPMLGRLRTYQKSNLNKWKAWIKREFSGNEQFYLELLLEA